MEGGGESSEPLVFNKQRPNIRKELKSKQPMTILLRAFYPVFNAFLCANDCTHTHTARQKHLYIGSILTQRINCLFILWRGFQNLNLANTTIHTCKDKSVLQHLRNHIMLLRLLHWWDPHTAQVPSNPKKIWPACRVLHLKFMYPFSSEQLGFLFLLFCFQWLQLVLAGFVSHCMPLHGISFA